MRRRPFPACRRCEGFALVELMVALILGLIVVLAMGRIILVNQSAWGQGRDKTILQQNVTEAMEWMIRSVREAHSLALISSQEYRTYDRSGTLLHTYRRDTATAPAVLRRDGIDLISRPCTQFAVTANADTTCLTIQLELADQAGDRVATTIRAAIRNAHLEF